MMMFLYEIVAAVGIAVATVVSPAPPVESVESCYVQSVGGFTYEICHVVCTSVDVAVWAMD